MSADHGYVKSVPRVPDAASVQGPAFGAPSPRWSDYAYETIVAEISSITGYYDHVVQCAPAAHDTGFLLHAIECATKETVSRIEDLPDLSGETERRSAVLLNGNFNYDTDIQGLLMRVKPKLSRTSRLVVVAYNPYLRGLWALANALGLRQAEIPTTFLTRVDLDNLARISGYEVVRTRPAVYVPFRLLGLGALFNAVMSCVPGLRWLAAVSVSVLRPLIPEKERPSLSVVIPARNEKGNIENALRRLPDLGGAQLEVIFVEGHSTDGTWEEIQRVIPLYRSRFEIKAYHQKGKGKCDAVRLGFSRASGRLLTVLDADLTMPPELLGRFYDAYCLGLGDFVNGNRLLYPMEGDAMRFFNRLGNVFFAKALSFVLDAHLGDSLCGTKLCARHDYERFVRWRARFGEFDPFGDFELLFPAAALALGIVDVSIRYRARTYGATNIHRFSHGWMLLKMAGLGLLRLKIRRVPKSTRQPRLPEWPGLIEPETRNEPEKRNGDTRPAQERR